MPVLKDFIFKRTFLDLLGSVSRPAEKGPLQIPKEEKEKTNKFRH